MTTVAMEPARSARTPWHLWLVGLIGLPWNGFGVYDYLCTQTRGEPYLREMGMTEAQISYFNSMPVWMTAAWAVGVWGALLGTLLLLARRKLAVPVYVASLAALILTLIYQFGLTNGAEVMGSGAFMSAVILAGAVFFVLYSRWAAKRRLLR